MATDGSRRIAGILVFAFVLRLGWAIVQPRSPEAIARLPDQLEYLSLGRSLLNTGSLCFVDPRFEQTIWAYRMPGYPAVIAACGGSVLVVRILQSLVDSSTVLAVYLLARGLNVPLAWASRPYSEPLGCQPMGGMPMRWKTSVALLAALLIAVNPFFIYFSGLLLSETIFTALLAWGLVLLMHRRLFFGALLFTASCYVRPAAVLMGPLIAFAAAANPVAGSAYRLLPALRRGLLAGAVVGILMVIALIPWAVRNDRRLGASLWTTTNGGVTLYDGFNPGATGASDQRFLAEMPAVRSMNEVDRSQFLAASARGWAKENPARLPLLSLRKILRSWSPIPLSSDFGRPVYRIISAMYTVPFDLLLVIGVCSKRITRGAKLVLVSPAVLIGVIEVMSVGSIRYRVPAEAPLAVLVAVGAVDIFGWVIYCRASVASDAEPAQSQGI